MRAARDLDTWTVHLVRTLPLCPYVGGIKTLLVKSHESSEGQRLCCNLVTIKRDQMRMDRKDKSHSDLARMTSTIDVRSAIFLANC